MRTNKRGLDIIKEYEGLRLKSYKCPAGVWTIGYGSTAGVKKGMEITESEADQRLIVDLMVSEYAIERAVKPLLNDNQFSALASFVFNVGAGKFGQSTLLKKLNAGDVNGAADEFLKWNKGGGKVLPGLVKRRAAERDLFLSAE